MLKDYETPNFKTPPKKLLASSSSGKALHSEDVTIEEIEMKIYEMVNNAVKAGQSVDKIEEIRERAYKDIIKSINSFVNLFTFLMDRPKARDCEVSEGTGKIGEDCSGES